jgi:DNA-directed RNA polymerase subunit beta'
MEDEYVNRFVLEDLNDELYDKFVVTDPGESDLEIGEIVDRRTLRAANSDLKRQDLPQVQVREAQPAVAEPVLLGITKAALNTDSFVSAASFQETTKVLTESSIHAKSDPLDGLKENVIVGHPIPAGTGQDEYDDLVVESRTEVEELQAALDGGGDGEAVTAGDGAAGDGAAAEDGAAAGDGAAGDGAAESEKSVGSSGS